MSSLDSLKILKINFLPTQLIAPKRAFSYFELIQMRNNTLEVSTMSTLQLNLCNCTVYTLERNLPNIMDDDRRFNTFKNIFNGKLLIQ